VVVEVEGANSESCVPRYELRKVHFLIAEDDASCHIVWILRRERL